MSELIADGEARTVSLARCDPARYVGVRQEPTWVESFSGEHPAH